MKTIGQTGKLCMSTVTSKHPTRGQCLPKVIGGMVAGSLAVLLTGCATVPLSLKPEQAQAIRKVAVVSVLGDEFDWKDWALLVWNNQRGTHQVAEWGIDASAEQAARRAIGEMSSYSIANVPELRGELLSVTKEEIGRGRRLKEPDAAPLLRRLGEKYGVDALVVISRGKLQRFPFSNRSVWVAGNGIAREMTMANLGAGRIALYSTVTVDVYSAKPPKIIASNQGFRWIHVDQALFDECMAGRGPEWDSGLKATVTNMIDAAVCDGIRYTRLANGPGEPSSSEHASEQVHGGAIPIDSKLAKIADGMTMREVYDQIGQPTGAVLYLTTRSINPLYAGDDQARFEALYRNLGRITFTGAGPKRTSFSVFKVNHDTKETGYSEPREHFGALYRVGREGCFNRAP